MPNIKSSAKRVLVSRKAAIKNRAARSLMRTNIKKFDTAVAGGDKKAAEAAFNVAAKTLDRAATKNLIHSNKAARGKSSMAKKLSSMS